MDPELASTMATDQVALCIHIGLLCTQADHKLRPTMQRVVVMLSKRPNNLEVPTRPGYPGCRYRRSRRPGGHSYPSSSTECSSRHESSSHAASTSASASASVSASTTHTATTTTHTRSPRPRSREKRPMQG